MTSCRKGHLMRELWLSWPLLLLPPNSSFRCPVPAQLQYPAQGYTFPEITGQVVALLDLQVYSCSVMTLVSFLPHLVSLCPWRDSETTPQPPARVDDLPCHEKRMKINDTIKAQVWALDQIWVPTEASEKVTLSLNLRFHFCKMGKTPPNASNAHCYYKN